QGARRGHRRDDDLLHRPRRVSGLDEAARRGMARAYGQSLSGDGADRGRRARRARRARRDPGGRVPGGTVSAASQWPQPKSFALEHARGVVTLTLDRPKRLNALTFEVYRELAETFEQLDSHDSVRAIVITGRGRGFCSGGDQADIIEHLLGKSTPE